MKLIRDTILFEGNTQSTILGCSRYFSKKVDNLFNLFFNVLQNSEAIYWSYILKLTTIVFIRYSSYSLESQNEIRSKSCRKTVHSY